MTLLGFICRRVIVALRQIRLHKVLHDQGLALLDCRFLPVTGYYWYNAELIFQWRKSCFNSGSRLKHLTFSERPHNSAYSASTSTSATWAVFGFFDLRLPH